MLRLLKIFLVNSFVFGLVFLNTNYSAIGADKGAKNTNNNMRTAKKENKYIGLCPNEKEVKEELNKMIANIIKEESKISFVKSNIYPQFINASLDLDKTGDFEENFMGKVNIKGVKCIYKIKSMGGQDFATIRVVK